VLVPTPSDGDALRLQEVRVERLDSDLHSRCWWRVLVAHSTTSDAGGVGDAASLGISWLASSLIVAW
jgi:hypothetical protein